MELIIGTLKTIKLQRIINHKSKKFTCKKMSEHENLIKHFQHMKSKKIIDYQINYQNDREKEANNNPNFFGKQRSIERRMLLPEMIEESKREGKFRK